MQHRHVHLATYLIVLVGCTVKDPPEPSAPGDGKVLEWNSIAVRTIGALPPFPSSRFMATTQVAVFEAVNAITHEYEPYLGTISAKRGASAEAAAVAAAHGVLRSYFEDQAETLDRERDQSLATIADGKSKLDGIAVGEAAAAAMLAERSADGSAPAEFYLPPNSDPYTWQPTANCTPAGGAFFHWRNVKPFGVQSSAQFRAEPPPALTSQRWAQDFIEVKSFGAATSTERPRDRADVAQIYAAQPPHIGWNSTARQLASVRRDGITKTARTLAMLNLTLSDVHITVFDTKYHYTTWRPETALPRGDEDSNDLTEKIADFTPFVVTPCFPSYPSAHGASSGGESTVLADAYGEAGHELTNSHPSVPDVVLHYTALQQIVRDVSDARVYGGIHFRIDQDVGEQLGHNVASYNIRRLMQPRAALSTRVP
jgi:hypothetical protein